MTTPALARPTSVSPLELYGVGLAGHVGGTRGSWRVRDDDGRVVPLDLARWCGPLSPADLALLDRCVGPTLDVGCGPGRLTSGLGARGVPVLGIDIAPGAVRVARAAGAVVLRRSVFDRVPGHGRWSRVLLADGNVGIGGDAVLLLDRVAELLAPDGRALVEVEPPGVATRVCRLRLEAPDGRVSRWFPWAHVGADGVAGVAAAAGLRVREVWTSDGRWFAACDRAGSPYEDAPSRD